MLLATFVYIDLHNVTMNMYIYIQLVEVFVLLDAS